MNYLFNYSNSQEVNEARIILGVTKSSSIKEIKKAFRTKAKQYHPDNTRNQQDGKQFSKIRNAYKTLEKTNSQLDCRGLEDIFKMVNNPQNIMSFFTEIIESSKPKKIESIVSLLQEEQYKKARKTYEITKEQSKKEANLIKETIQHNFKRKNILNSFNLETHLNELKFYANETLFNYQKALEEIQPLVLSQLKNQIEEEKYFLSMKYTAFEKYLQNNFDLIDSIPLDTQHIEKEFEEYIIKKTIKEINPYNIEKTKDAINKLFILDEYYAPDEDSHKIIKESYDTFLKPFRGKIVDSGVKSNIRKVLSIYHIEGGLDEARKLYGILGMTNRI